MASTKQVSPIEGTIRTAIHLQRRPCGPANFRPQPGVAHDPAGPPGELLEFFAPGLNEPLRAPIGPHSSYEPARSPVLRELQRYSRFAALDGPASTSVRAVPPAAAALEPDVTAKRAVPVLAKFIGDSLITPAQAALPSRPLSPGRAGPNPPTDESTFGDRSDYAQGAPSTDTYPRLRRISFAFPGIAPPNPGQPAPPPEPAPVLRIVSGRPMSPWPLPPSVFGLPDNSGASGKGDWFNFLAGLASPNPAQPAPAPTADSKQVRILTRGSSASRKLPHPTQACRGAARSFR